MAFSVAGPMFLLMRAAWRVARAIAKRIAGVTLFLLGVLLLGRLALATASGQRWLARQVSTLASRQIAGKLAIDRIALQGWHAATARDIRLLAPDGTPTAAVQSLSVRVSIPSLLRRKPVIESVDVSGLTADLSPGREGQAEPSKPPGVGEPERAKPLDLTVESIHVDLADVRYRKAPGTFPALHIRKGVVDARLHLSAGAVDFSASARLDLVAPAQGPAIAEVAGSYSTDSLVLRTLHAQLPGGARIEAGTTGPAAPKVSGAAAGLTLPPVHIDASLPADGLAPYGGPSLAGPIRAGADVSLVGGHLSFDVVARPRGTGEVIARGSVREDASALRIFVAVRELDPSDLLRGTVAGRLTLEIEAEGAARPPPHADLRATVRIAPSHVAGQPLGPGHADIFLQGKDWRVQDLQLALPRASLCVPLLAGGGGKPVTGEMTFSSEELAALASLIRGFGIHPPKLGGDVRLTAETHGDGIARTVRIAGASRAARIGALDLRATSIDASQRSGVLQGQVRTTTPRGSAELSLRAHLIAPSSARLDALDAQGPGMSWRLARQATVSWGKRIALHDFVLAGPGRIAVNLALGEARGGAPRSIDGRIQVQELQLAALAGLLPQDQRPQGTLEAAVSVHGTSQRPDVQTSVDGEGIALPGIPVGALRASLRGTRERITATADLQQDQARAHLDVDLATAGPGPIWSLPGLLAARGTVNAHVREVELAALKRLGMGPAGLSGILQVDLSARGSLRRPDVTGDAQVSNLAFALPGFGTLPPTASQVHFRGDASSTRVDLSATVRGAPPLTGSLVASAPLRELLDVSARQRVPVRGRLEVAPGPARLESVQVLASRMQLAARLSGTLGIPNISLSAQLAGLAVRAHPVGDLSASAEVQTGRWTATADVSPAAGGTVAARVDFARDGSWSGTLRAHEAHLDGVPGVIGLRGAVLEGELEASKAPAAAPRAEGALRASARSVDVPGAEPLADIEVALEAAGQSVRIRRLAARGVAVTGMLRWDGSEWATDLDAVFDGFSISSPGVPRALLTTRVQAQLEVGHEVNGDIAVGAGELRVPQPTAAGHKVLPVTLPGTVHVHAPGEEAPKVPVAHLAAASPRPVHVRARIARDFWLRSPELNAEVTAQVTAQTTIPAPEEHLALLGGVQIPEGNVTFAGRRFVIQRLSLQFLGNHHINPTLDGLLIYQAPDSEVDITLAGTLNDPQVNFSSIPPMANSEIAALLASNIPSGTPSPTTAGLVLSGAANLALGGLQNAISGALPIDVFNVQLGGTGQVQRLEAGTYVTPNLFLSFARNFLATGGQNSSEVQADYRLSRSVSVRSYFGDEAAAGASLRWQRQFRSQAQKRAANQAGSPAMPGTPRSTTGAGGSGQGAATGGDFPETTSNRK